MSEPRPVVIEVTVVTSDPEQVTRTIEAFARAAAGLALEGVYVEIATSTPECESVEDE